jgi:hypothetical protein
VLDDYDIVYKEQGVLMVHGIIQKLKPEYISKFGLDNVFFEVKKSKQFHSRAAGLKYIDHLFH